MQVNDRQKHQKGFKDVEVHLRFLNGAICTLNEFDGAKKRTYHNQTADNVEGTEVALPTHLRTFRRQCRSAAD